MHTLDQLQKILRYEKDSGKFYWIKGRKGTAAGAEARNKDRRGYIRITVDGVHYYAHRLVWLFETDNWPKNDIDHIDQLKSNNKFENLRDVTRSENMMNRPAPSQNISGYKGVQWHQKLGKWMVRKRRKYIGVFEDINLAAKAYEVAT
jgi:hypothetical protein